MPLMGKPLEEPIRIPHLLRAGLARSPDDIALVSAATRCSWRSLESASENLAGNYLDRGLRPGDRVASLMPNRIALMIHYIACLKAGLACVPLNYRYTVPEIDRALSISQASMLIAHAERAQDLDACRKVHALPHGLLYDEAEDGHWPGLRSLIDSPSTTKEFPVPAPGEPAFIYFTSGSTGPAKGVTHSREGFGWMLANYAAALALTPGDVMLPASSMSHISGSCFSLAALAVGARAVVAHSFDSQHMLPLLRAQKPTVLWMQPVLLSQLLEDPDALPADFQTLRHLRSGGDRVPAALRSKFTELTGLAISEGLGMTEVGIVTGHPPAGTIKAGSIGQAAPGVRISIRDDDDREVPAGVEGRMLISAPQLMVGYWADPVATEAVVHDGWLDSGDIVKTDDEGYVTFCGRKKHLIVHDGSNISPLEVEDALLQHPAVAMAGVVGIADAVHGENVCAYVALKPDAPAPTAQELIQFARARVGYKAPGKIVFLAALPLNSGKVDRAALKLLAAKEAAAAAG
jgi:acyl-CoA synthetase (AMP-forming)/AMP-acid ligase II